MTGLEPVTSAVTGRRSSQLNYMALYFLSHCVRKHRAFTSNPQILAGTVRVGFEPTCPFGQTVFKTAALWPLRYLTL